MAIHVTKGIRISEKNFTIDIGEEETIANLQSTLYLCLNTTPHLPKESAELLRELANTIEQARIKGQ